MKFSAKNRNEIIKRLSNEKFDVLVIGGGITGAGIALDAVSRGLKTALVEMQDFASGTSSRSTKLIHGGLRYLKQFEFGLVAEVGKERRIVHHNTPHLTHPEKMFLPIVKNGSLGKFTARLGMTIYEWLAGVKEEEKFVYLDKNEAEETEPLADKKNLLGGILFYEYRTDDARLTIETVKEAFARGAAALNYSMAASFVYEKNKIVGAKILDQISSEEYEIKADYIVNAGGPWVDSLDSLDKNSISKKLQITKGIHLVVDRNKLPIKQAAYFDTFDKRMIFVIPREGKTYIGTTDTFYNGDLTNPHITKEDRDYLIKCVNQFFPSAKLTTIDIESSWAGLRPLVKKPGKKPSEISRKDELFFSASGLITIAGGKLTGYRKMAERVVNIISKKISKSSSEKIGTCITDAIPLSGGKIPDSNIERFLKIKTAEANSLGISVSDAHKLIYRYGANVDEIFKIYTHSSDKNVLNAELHYCIENEMCTTSSDFFVRRTGMLYFDSHAAANLKQAVTAEMARALQWTNAQQEKFSQQLSNEINESRLSDLL